MAQNELDADWTISTYNSDDDDDLKQRIRFSIRGNLGRIRQGSHDSIEDAIDAAVNARLVEFYKMKLSTTDYQVVRHLEQLNRSISTTLDNTKYNKLCENRDTWRGYIVTYG